MSRYLLVAVCCPDYPVCSYSSALTVWHQYTHSRRTVSSEYPWLWLRSMIFDLEGKFKVEIVSNTGVHVDSRALGPGSLGSISMTGALSPNTLSTPPFNNSHPRLQALLFPFGSLHTYLRSKNLRLALSAKHHKPPQTEQDSTRARRKCTLWQTRAPPPTQLLLQISPWSPTRRHSPLSLMSPT